jgi:hypothetical protein
VASISSLPSTESFASHATVASVSSGAAVNLPADTYAVIIKGY